MAAERFVDILFPKLHQAIALRQAMRELGRAATLHANGMYFLDILGDSHQRRHRAEWITEKISVKPGNNHPNSRVGKFLSHFHEFSVKELRLVNSDHIGSLRKFQHLRRRIHREGPEMLAVMGHDILFRVAYIYAGFKHRDFLVGELGTPDSSNKFFSLAREHRAADDFNRTCGFNFFKKHFRVYLSKLSNFAVCNANIIKYRVMENNHTQFLTDILTQIQSLKKQIEQLEAQVVEHIGAEAVAETHEEEDLPDTETHQTEQKLETVTEPTLLDEDDDLPEDNIIEEQEKETEIKNTTDVVDLRIDDDFEVLPLGEALAPLKDAVMDKMAEKESWRTDMPGSGVNDIRSAISLNDRILFINTLFHEDPIAFKDTLGALNAMPSFEDGIRYLKDRHPEWNTESEVVYRFMMAVRRKLK